MPAVTTNLHIRKGPGTDYKIIGKMAAGSYAYILEIQDGWAKIATGTIEEGYVSTEYLFTQEEVIEYCDPDGIVTATVTTATLNVRSGPGTHYERIKRVVEGNTFNVILGKSYEGWYALEFSNGVIGYASDKYLDITIDLEPGYTTAELKQMKEWSNLEAALNLKPGEGEAVSQRMIKSIEETTRAPISATEEEIALLAKLVYTEAGGEKYEGKLAVANIVLNRLQTGYWGDTISEVIYAKGQFSGTKYFERADRRGVTESCYTAAREALAGRNNIGKFLYYRTTTSAYNANKTGKGYSLYTSFYILGDHVFYTRPGWKQMK